MFGTSDPLVAAAEAFNPTPPKGTPYSVPIPGSKVEGRSAVYRHWDYVNKPLLETLVPSLRTVHDGFEHAATKYPKNRCLGHRPYDTTTKTWGAYVWQDYQTIQTRRKNLGAGLVHLHKQVGVTKESYGIGLWCQNRPEWQITDLAAMSQRLYSVSIYDTLGPDTTEYIINHSELVCVATSLNHVTALLKLKSRLPTLKLIMVLDPISSGELPGESKADILNSLAAEVGVSIHYIKDVEALGESNPLPMKAPTPDDIVTINYTSGTTGNPKGVVLPHRAAWAAANVSMMFFPTTPSAVLCSFLPLAHIFERLGENSALSAGASIGYFHGDITQLVDDLKLVRPTQFSGVPRLYNRFGGAIKAATTEQPGFKGALSRHVISTKLAAINDKHNPTSKHAIYDRIWAKKVAAGIGLDRAANMVSGSAPIDPTLHQFLRVCFANSFVQGWGMTESYALGLIQDSVNDYSTGTCGGVVPATEACLVDVPDMEYFSTDKPFPRGELVVRGSTIFREYLGNPEETAKTLDAEGWLHTGDIATIDAQGRFKIIDRKKNVLKLAQGEYISPERIENVYLANCPWIATAYVHGDSQQAFLVALLGVAVDMFPAFASKVLGEKIEVGDVESLRKAITDKRVEQAVLKELLRVGKKSKFNSYENVKAVRLFIDPFTIDNELLTPTLKLKRPQTVKKYRKELDDCYEEALAAEASGKNTKAKL